MIKFSGFILLLIMISLSTIAQEQSQNEPVTKPHSPKSAVLRSAILPGLGQAYNKKYWKIPVLYIGIAAITYSIDYNYRNYKQSRNAYIYKTDNDTTTKEIEVYKKYSEEQVLQIVEYFRRNLDFAVIGAALIYIANIIDANVDAHLFNFNLSDDLSLHVEPRLLLGQKGSHVGGVAFTIQL